MQILRSALSLIIVIRIIIKATIWVLNCFSCFFVDSPLRSLLPLDFFSTLLSNIHKRHILLQKSLETVEWGSDNRIVVVHYDMGIMLLDCSSGRKKDEFM